MTPDHYRALGVRPGASRDEIRAAYLRLMRRHHPDRRPGDPMAADAARTANAAWNVLRDQRRRAAYDRSRRAGMDAPVHAATTVTGRDGAAGSGAAAYSPAGTTYRRAVTHAMVRMGVSVFLLGLLFLLLPWY